MDEKTIHIFIKMSQEMIDKFDEWLEKNDYKARTEYIREVIRETLKYDKR